MIMNRADEDVDDGLQHYKGWGLNMKREERTGCSKMIAPILSCRDMEAFLKTGKVGAGAGGSKPMAKEKKEKKQAPVSYMGWI